MKKKYLELIKLELEYHSRELSVRKKTKVPFRFFHAFDLFLYFRKERHAEAKTLHKNNNSKSKV